MPAHGSVELAPGHTHLMLVDITAPLKPAATIKVTLHFEKAGDLTVDVPVRDGRLDRSSTITDGAQITAAPHTRRWLVVIAATVAAVIGGAVGRHYWQSEPLPKIGGYVLAEPQALPPVALVDEQGRAFRPTDFAGHWSFLYFGYTYCPDVCPLTLVELAALKKRSGRAAPRHADRLLPRVRGPATRHTGAAARVRHLLRCRASMASRARWTT